MIPESLRPRDSSFGSGLLWAGVGMLTALWLGGISGDLLKKFAVPAGITAVALPIVYITVSIVRQRRETLRSRTWSISVDGNPYPSGLEPFDSGHSAVLFGRDMEIRRILQRVRFDTAPARRFVPMEGPSGCGKSSILRAGILPELTVGVRRFALPNAKTFDVVGPFTPSLEPFRSLASAISQDGPGSSDEAVLIEKEGVAAAADLNAGRVPQRPDYFLSCLTAHRKNKGRSVIGIDQLEELVVGVAVERRQAFMALLGAALYHDRRVAVVCALRSDFSGQFLEGPGKDLFRDAEKIDVMGPAQLRQVIKGPAAASGVRIDEQLVDRMVDEAQGGDALPLLSFVLHTLYERSAKDRAITADEYDRVTGANNAIARYADDVVDRIAEAQPAPNVRSVIFDVLLEAVNIADGGVARRRFDASFLPPTAVSVADALTEARLFARGGDGRYEITHEVLLRQWPSLRQAIEENRESLRIRTLFEARARDWIDDGRPSTGLLTPSELKRVRGYAGRLRGPVGELISVSVRHDVTEMARRADLVAGQALIALDPPRPVKDPELALRLSEAANVELRRTLLAAYALYRSWWYGLRGVLRGHSADVTVVAWCPDGGRLAAASADQTARIWSTDGTALAVLTGHAGGVNTIVWSPDGTRLATASADQTVCIWSTDGTVLHKLVGHTATVNALAWSPDGTLLASASYDGTARVWSANGTYLHVLAGHTDRIYAVAWSPDGTQLATASHDQSVRTWSADGIALSELTGHAGAVTAVDWSPDGTQLASAAGQTARIWSADGTAFYELFGHAERVSAVAWSSFGTRLATASYDQTVRTWSAEATALREMTGHAGAVSALSWAPDGTELASTSIDQTARTWSCRGTALHELAGHSGTVNAAAWSPDSSCFATASVDHTLRIWSRNGAALHELFGHSGTVSAVAWSPDGTLLASASYDRTARIWSSNGDATRRLTGHSDRVYAVAWSADGTRIATASHDQTVRIWSCDGTALHELTGHTAAVNVVAWSSDGKRLATASHDKTVRIWSCDGTALHELTGHTAAVNVVAWSPDGTLLASASSDQTARIWSADGTALAALTGHTGTVNAVVWSPDGKRLATASHDKTVRIWSCDGTALHELTGHTDRVYALAWSPDGTRLASGGGDSTVRYWPEPLATDELLSLVGTIVGLKELSPDDRLRSSLPLD